MKALESALYVDDLPAAHDFYTRILGLEEIAYDADRHLFLRLEGSVLILFNPSRTMVPDADIPTHGTKGPGHFAFAATDKELDSWRDRLVRYGVPIEQDHTWESGAKSIYFRDPAGNSLEFAEPALWGIV